MISRNRTSVGLSCVKADFRLRLRISAMSCCRTCACVSASLSRERSGVGSMCVADHMTVNVPTKQVLSSISRARMLSYDGQHRQMRLDACMRQHEAGHRVGPLHPPWPLGHARHPRPTPRLARQRIPGGGARSVQRRSSDQVDLVRTGGTTLTRSDPEPNVRRPPGGGDVVLSAGAAELDELEAPAERATLHELLSRSPLNRLDFEGERVRSPVRDAWRP